MPRGVLDQLVGVRVVLVVLDAPGLKGVQQRGEHQGAHDVLHQVVLVEGPAGGEGRRAAGWVACTYEERSASRL